MDLPRDLPRWVEKAATHWMVWGWKAPAGHTLEHVMDPEYWVHALQSMSIGQHDTIRVIAQDGSFGADLLVVEIDERRLWARVRLLQDLPIAGEDAEADGVPLKDPDGWQVGWGGPVHKWRVFSPAGVLAAKGFSTRVEAEAALAGMKPARAA